MNLNRFDTYLKRSRPMNPAIPPLLSVGRARPDWRFGAYRPGPGQPPESADQVRPAIVPSTDAQRAAHLPPALPRLAGSAIDRAFDEEVTVGKLTIDHNTYEARECGELVLLTRTEFLILDHLAAHVGKLRSPAQLMSAVHGYKFADFEARQAVAVFVQRIRRKLAACAYQSVEIVNSRAVGYRLQALDRPDRT